MAFSNYSETGTPLLTATDKLLRANFRLTGVSSTIANVLRRAILVDTRSASFRADLTDAANPGIRINKNTSSIFNEMLAHRLTLLPLAVVRLNEFQPERYECVLQRKNTSTTEYLHVKASDFILREKQADGSWAITDCP